MAVLGGCTERDGAKTTKEKNMTTFGDQVFQFGGSAVGGALSMGIMGGGAKSFFVDPANGANGNSGRKQDAAKDTVGQAYALTTDKKGDVIYFLNDGNTTGSSRESTIPLAWSNDNIHLIGCCAPVPMSQRARITPATTAALTANPMITVSGHGNSFWNLQIAHFGANTDSIAARGLDVTGNRNYFYNCHIVGVPNAHTGDEAAAADLKVTGEENMFERCYFGTNTVTRSTTNANVELTSQATRIHFKECFFTVYADNAGVLFVKIDAASDIDREIVFDNCIFYNPSGAGATTMTAAMDVHASAGGDIIVKDCMLVGASDWEAADASNIHLMCHTQTDTGGIANMGIAVTVDVTE
jgi:hypothetical protein